MVLLGELCRRLVALFRGSRLERDLNDEIAFHLEMREQEQQRAGVSPTKARKAVHHRFGNVSLLKDQIRDAWIWPGLQDLLHDIRFAIRLLVKERWFTLSSVGALGLAIGVSTAVFTVVNASVLRDLPVPNPGRLISLGTRDGSARDLPVVSRPDFDDWRTATSFSDLVLFVEAPMHVKDDQRPSELLLGSYVSHNVFRLVNERSILGREFRRDDDRVGAPPVAILGYRTWHMRYGADPSVLGRTITVDGHRATVIGVMREGMTFPFASDLWLPAVHHPGFSEPDRAVRMFGAVGRLTDDVRIEHAHAELSAISARLSDQYPDTNKNIELTLQPFHERYTDVRLKLILWALMGAAAFVLLIAWLNLVTLHVSRSAQRISELALRLSLGATRLRLIRQLTVESIVLACMTAGLGWMLATAGVRLITTATAEIPLAFWMRFTMDGRVVGFFGTLVLGTVVVSCLAATQHLSRAQACEALSGRGVAVVGGFRPWPWTNILVVADLSLTLMLLAGAGLMIRSSRALSHPQLGIDTTRLLTARITLSTARYSRPDQRASLHRRLEERLNAHALIDSATMASHLPYQSGMARSLTVPGQPREGPAPIVTVVNIGVQYFETLGLAVLHGRSLNEADGPPGHESAVVNERFVALCCSGTDPIGQRITLSSEVGRDVQARSLTIVGVAPNVRQRNQQQLDPDPVAYLPLATDPVPSISLIARGSSDPAGIAPIVRQELAALDPDVPLSEVLTLDRALLRNGLFIAIFAAFFGSFSVIALAVSVVGLYATMAHAVTQRTREIGVRMALGAAPAHIFWFITGRASAPVALGVVFGISAALGVGRILRSVLFQTTATDPPTMISVAVLLVAAVTAGCCIPALRAARLDPSAALRHE